MGIKGDKRTSAADDAASLIEGKLAPLGGITTKKMFGGYGIFHDGKMFGLINPKGSVFVKYDKDNPTELEALGGEKHAKMPYFSVPDEHVNAPVFVDVVNKAIQLSK